MSEPKPCSVIIHTLKGRDISTLEFDLERISSTRMDPGNATMNVLEVLRAHGFDLTRAAATNGGEYCGPCPKCGGRDRFSVWPAGRGTGGRFWCRGCRWNGDALTLLMELRMLSFIDACRELGVSTDFTKTTRRHRGKETRTRLSFLAARETPNRSHFGKLEHDFV